MLGPVARISHQCGRNVMKTFVRNGSRGGVPGENLPFRIDNKARFTTVFFLYVMTGIGAPFALLDFQLRKTAAN